MWIAQDIFAKIDPKDTVDKLNKSKLMGNVNINKMVLPLVSCWWCSLLLLTKSDGGQRRNNQPTNGGAAAAAARQREVSGSLGATVHSPTAAARCLPRGGSAVPAAWRQRDRATLAAAWRRCCSGGSVSGGGGSAKSGGSSVVAAAVAAARHRDVGGSLAVARRWRGGSGDLVWGVDQRVVAMVEVGERAACGGMF